MNISEKSVNEFYKLLNEGEEQVEQNQPSEEQTEQNEGAQEQTDVEGEEEGDNEEDLPILVCEYKMGSKNVYCSTVYAGEKEGPFGESAECHNLFLIANNNELNDAKVLDYYGDEEMPDMGAVDWSEVEGAEDADDSELVDCALMYFVMFAYLYFLISQADQSQVTEMKNQGINFDEVNKVGKPAAETFSALGITKEDIQQFYEDQQQ